MQLIDWEKPQRQPIAGLAIVFLKTVGEFLKRLWPFILLALFRDKPEESRNIDKYEWLAILATVFAFLYGVMQYVYFRFYIIHNELIIKKGWLKKQTAVIPLRNIHTVQIEASFLHQLLGVVKLRADTAGSDKTEVKIDALKREMADALRMQLQQHEPVQRDIQEEAEAKPVLTLNDKDLFKLSLSANHVETFFLLLSFGFGIYDNLNTINIGLDTSTERFLPKETLLIVFLISATLLFTILISTARIFLKFYGFRVSRVAQGFHIRTGLINKKEHAVTFRKIQAVAWKTNWIRRYFGFWMLEYRIAGGNEVGGKMRVQVPVTHASHLPGLINAYHPMPDGLPADPVHMHASIIGLRMLITGMISVLLLLVSWPWWEFASLVFLLLPLYTAFYTFLQQRKFRMWVMEDSICLMRGAYGTEMALLQWNKIQAISLKQSSFQRKRSLATLILYTASDNFTIQFIPLPAAQAIMNYGLYKIESSREGWM